MGNKPAKIPATAQAVDATPETGCHQQSSTHETCQDSEVEGSLVEIRAKVRHGVFIARREDVMMTLFAF